MLNSYGLNAAAILTQARGTTALPKSQVWNAVMASVQRTGWAVCSSLSAALCPALFQWQRLASALRG